MSSVRAEQLKLARWSTASSRHVRLATVEPYFTLGGGMTLEDSASNIDDKIH